MSSADNLGRRYHVLLVAYVISDAGTWLYRLTLPLLVLHLTGSALQTAALYTLEYGPFLLLSLPGGVFADWFDRKRLLIVGDGTAGLIALGLAVLVATGISALPAIYVVAFLLACVEPVYHPAFQGLLPEITPSAALDRANALMQSADNILSLVGPVIAGGLVALIGYQTAIYLDAASFAASAAIISLIRVDRVASTVNKAAKRGAQFLVDLRVGLRYTMRENRVLFVGSLLFTGTNFGIWLIQANLVYYLTTYLHLTSTVVGVVFAAQGVGALVGSLVAPPLIKLMGNGRAIVVSTMVAGICTGLLVVVRDPIGVCVVYAVVFALGSINVVAWFTLRQRIVRRDMLGRVVAATRMVAFSSIPIASLVAGGVEQAIHNMYLLIAVGAALRLAVGVVGSVTGLAGAGRRTAEVATETTS
ncbi:MAG TPA: MFS transporter [Pseudonocardiaceae bacterium]|nr:MFS transporter [Pseudonocardiaceae bacterium]